MVWCGSSPSKCFGNNKADSDIAGIGVITAFVTTSAITLVAAFTGHFLGMTRGYENNDIDVWLSNRLQKYSLFRIRDHKKALWTPIIEKFVLTLSDQQLLVGIAILIAGFAQHCSISVYHFSIVTDLAWFSSNTHLVTLDVLRVYLAGEPTLRLWRICLMLGTVVLLIVGVIFEGHRAWYDSWYSDAQCLFDDLRGNVGGLPAKWMAINIVLIVYNYTTSIFGLLQKSWEGDIVDRTLEVWYNNLQKQKIALAKKKDLGLTASYAAQLGAYSISFCFLFFCTALSTILGSLTVSLLINVGWFAVGLWSIVEDRSVSPSDIDGDENRWAFGQIVPVLLLSSAVFTLKELHSEQRSKLKGNLLGDEHYQRTHNRHNSEDGGSELLDRRPNRVDTEAGGRAGASGVEQPSQSEQAVRRTNTGL